MLHLALLAASLTLAPATSAPVAKTAIQQCFTSMDGAVYHGDPSDRSLMRSDVTACEQGLALIARMRTATAQGPEKLYLTGRILDRAATLSYIGLSDAATALREVTLANLYFRVASGLTTQTPNYREAALANVELTNIQLHTLRAELALAHVPRPTKIAHTNATVYTAYHKM